MIFLFVLFQVWTYATIPEPIQFESDIDEPYSYYQSAEYGSFNEAPFTVMSLPSQERPWSRKDTNLWNPSLSLDLLNLTARIDGERRGTAFYVGYHGGRYLMMTNYHTFTDQMCGRKQTSVYFQQLKQRFRCGKVIAQFKDIEVTFFSIYIPEHFQSYFQTHRLQFDFQNPAKIGEPLVTAGYGTYLTPGSRMTFEDSTTCKVLTDPNQARFIQVKNTPYMAWSFIHGCEISPGDSGSAVLNKQTQKIVGINWASHFDRSKDVENYRNIESLVQSQAPKLWTSFALVVPALKIKEHVEAHLRSAKPEDLSIPILESFLKAQ